MTTAPLLLYTRMVERGIRKQVQETTKKQKELLGGERELENAAPAPATIESSSTTNLDYKRYRLVRKILFPLIESLSECYKIVDQLPQPQPKKEEQEIRSHVKSNPIPPWAILPLHRKNSCKRRR